MGFFVSDVLADRWSVIETADNRFCVFIGLIDGVAGGDVVFIQGKLEDRVVHGYAHQKLTDDSVYVNQDRMDDMWSGWNLVVDPFATFISGEDIVDTVDAFVEDAVLCVDDEEVTEEHEVRKTDDQVF